MDRLTEKEMASSKTVGEKLLDELHRLAGVCGHCGKKKCAAKKKWSQLPERLNTDDVLAAIRTATGEDL